VHSLGFILRREFLENLPLRGKEVVRKFLAASLPRKRGNNFSPAKVFAIFLWLGDKRR
jgi:hypothetical protein